MAARKPDIQYITQFYTHGSEAQVIELKPVKKERKTVLPKAIPQEKIRIMVDPAAICGIVVAAAMLVLMVVGVVQYLDICEEYRVMNDYVIELQNENVQLQQTYKTGYDLDDVETKALALGMIPRAEAETVTIHVEVPVEEPAPTWWENICWYFGELFA